MKAESTSTQLKNGLTLTPSLRASVFEGMLHAIMLGCGETFFGAFGVFLKATPLQIGLLGSLPQLIGAGFQALAVWFIRHFRNRLRTLVTAALFNGLIWLPISMVALFCEAGPRSVWITIGLVALYYGSAGFVAPIWSSLIGDLVPAEIRGRYFGMRNMKCGFATFLAFLTCGQILQFARSHEMTSGGFGCIFFVAGLSRLLSVLWLMRYENPEFHSQPGEYFSFWQFLRRSPRSNYARFVFFVSMINFGVFFSAPYFAVYMLHDLQFSYIQYTVVSAAATLTQVVTMQYWGVLSDRFGNKKILNVCGFGVCFSPVLWLFSSNVWYLLVAQTYGGIVWAGFNLAAANFLFDAVSPPKRARCFAYHSIINGCFVLCGSLAGGFTLGHLPQTISFGFFSWTPASPLLMIFLISGLIRLVAGLILIPRFKEVRPVENIRHRDLIFRIVHIRAMAGATFGILSGNGRTKEDAVTRR